MAVEPPEGVEQPGAVEASVVVDPLDDTVEHPWKVVEGPVCDGQVPRADRAHIAFIASLLRAVRNDTKCWACRFLAARAATHTPGTLTRCAIRTHSIHVLAVTMRVLSGCNSRPTCARQQRSRPAYGLAFDAAVHHDVIAVPFEPDIGDLLDHPSVEREMHGQSASKGEITPQRNGRLACWSPCASVALEVLSAAGVPGGMRCRMVIFSGPMRTSLTSSRSTRWRSSGRTVSALWRSWASDQRAGLPIAAAQLKPPLDMEKDPLWSVWCATALNTRSQGTVSKDPQLTTRVQDLAAARRAHASGCTALRQLSSC